MIEYTINFNNDTLKSYLLDFDPTYEKFGVKIDDSANTGLHSELVDYEKSRFPLTQREDEYYDIYKNLKLVYGCGEPIEDYIQFYNLTLDKIVRKYLGIQGLDRLFTAQYFRYEWEMHLGLDFENHTPSFYRDHFIHQIRDACTVHKLLRDLELMKDVKKSLLRRETKVSEYICKYMENSANEIWEHDRRKKLYVKIAKSRLIVQDKDIKEHIENLVLERIILTSELLSALFHDIGYPIEFSMKNHEHIENYLPNIYYFLSGEQHFDRVTALLGNSLLFNIVPVSEIRQRFIERNHGALSALAFLLYFYENGAIYSQNETQRPSIELAGLIIYDHTLKGRYSEPKEKTSYFRNVYSRNPLAYIFRLCDDIQEWDRTYFLLDDNHTMRLCEKCGCPIVKRKFKLPGDKSREAAVCGCAALDGIDNNSFVKKLSAGSGTATFLRSAGDIGNSVLSDITYRRLNHVKACKTVRLEKYGLKSSAFPDARLLRVVVDYEPSKLLQITSFNPEFSIYRAKDLNILRRNLDFQSGFPGTIIEAFITTNPILLKVRILEEYLINRMPITADDIDLRNPDCNNHKLFLSNADEAFLLSFRKDIEALTSGKLQGPKLTKKIKRKLDRLVGFVYNYGHGNIIDRIRNRVYMYFYLMLVGMHIRGRQGNEAEKLKYACKKTEEICDKRPYKSLQNRP